MKLASLLLPTWKQEVVYRRKNNLFFLFVNIYMCMHMWIQASSSCLLQCFKSSTNLIDRCISKFSEQQFYIFSDRKVSFLAFTHNPFLSALLQFFFFFWRWGLGEGSVLKSFITFQLHVNSVVLETSFCCSYQLYQNFRLMRMF